MERRDFLAQLSLVAAAGCGLTGCRRSPTRDVVLTAIVHDVLAADVAAIGEASRRMDDAIRDLASEPTDGTLARAREAWKVAVTRWKRGYCYRNGPLVETAALLRAAFWPARPSAIEALLANPLPQGDFVAELGVDVKGLYALEYLLFGGGDDSTIDAGPFGTERRRDLTSALSGDVVLWAAKAEASLGDGKKLAKRMARGGKETLDFLVNQMAGTAESVQQRLTQVRELAESDRLKPRDVEGWPSGMSTEIVDTLVAGTERLYLGERAGLEGLVASAAPAQIPRFRALFGDLRAALQRLEGPMEVAARRKPRALQGAALAAKNLELALKVELPSLLGVTLTFSSTDGD